MSAKWHIQRGRQEFGPYTWEELRGYSRNGNVAKDDLVKSEQMAEWIAASEIPGLIQPVPGSSSLTSSPSGKTGKNITRTLAIAGGSVLGLALVAVIAIIAYGYLTNGSGNDADPEKAEPDTLPAQVIPDGNDTSDPFGDDEKEEGLAVEPEEAAKSVDEAIMKWWAGTDAAEQGDLIIDIDLVDESFFEEHGYDQYRYGYSVLEEGDYSAMVIVGIIESEMILQLELEKIGADWAVVQVRNIPTVGYDMLDRLGSTREDLITSYGDPNEVIALTDPGGEAYFYDHISTGFYFRDNAAIVNGMEIYGQGASLFSTIYVGANFEDIEPWLGEPDEKGHSAEIEALGLPSYEIFYVLDDASPEGVIELFLLSSGENEPIEYIRVFLN